MSFLQAYECHRRRQPVRVNQAELARPSGIDRATISRLEAGKASDPSGITIIRIAKASGGGKIKAAAIEMMMQE
jgi:predicted transcriptional regulator